jgi:electron transport complex protein RnfG
VIGLGLVTLVHGLSAERIARQQQHSLRLTLQTLVPAGSYDNDPLADRLSVRDARLGVEAVPIYPARRQGQPVAAVIAPVAADGYSGDIRLLVAVLPDGTLIGVRVLAHKETPGLGDAIAADKSDWILRFNGLSLANPMARLWKVKRDGGSFDQFAGATVTPRAVVNAVRNTLAYFRDNRAAVFAGNASGAKLTVR